MLSNFAEKKETFFDLKKTRTFSKGPFFLIYSDLVKIRVEIMLKLH